MGRATVTGRPTVPVGRDAERDALAGDGRSPAVAVLRGPAGSGRTVLLEHLASRHEKDAGTTVLRLRPGVHRDVHGVEALLAATRERFEHLDADASLGVVLAAIRRAGAPTASPRQRATLPVQVARLVGELGRRRRVVVIADDADTRPQPVPVLDAARAAGALVLCSVTSGPIVEPGVRDLLAHADRVVDLPPLGPEQVDDVVAAAVRARPGPDLRAALERDLGPWRGNPAAVLRAVRVLSESGGLSLRRPDRVLRLPVDHPPVTLARTAGPGAAELTVAAARPGGLDLDALDLLASAIGVDVDACDRTADALVAAGVLDHEDGLLALAAPAVGATVRDLLGDAVVDRLVAAIGGPADRGDRPSTRHPPPGTAEHPGEAGGLTALEREIVELVRAGRTNRQIATRITASEKAVEKHLTRLYLRTGCRTRHELAVADVTGRLEARAPEGAGARRGSTR